MTESKICTCPSGDGSLRWPCPAHPAVDQADVAAKLTFINGRPAMCGCQVEYSDGGGEYSDVIYVTLCAKHSGSAILDLVATNRIALTPEYEGQWHADLYLDREIPLAKVEGATPAEAVIALMSAERIDPEQESVEQAGGDRWDALQSIMEWTASENIPDERKLCLIRNAARAALAQPSPKCATCNDSGQIVVSGPHYQGEFQPPEYETEPCDMCAQPSPAQAEQAEAERPEVAEVAFVLRNIGAMDAEDIDGDNVDLRFEDAEGRDTGCDVSIVEYAEKAADLLEQQDRIVGELRADRDSWAEQAEQRLADWDEMRKERDAALVRVEQQERTIAGMNEAHAKLAGLYEAAQAQHSVPDGASDLCRFLAKLYCELDGLRYSTAKLPAEQIADALIFKWPVLQGARNQLNIKRISEQPYDESKLHSAIAAMLAAAPAPGGE
ncbi:hypothetical protein I5E63_04300 [Pseudomonas aeruginosa]|nr:hypothetical protein [Pseudomonas aeruginosa]